MRQLVRILSVIGLAAAIADRGAAMADSDIDKGRHIHWDFENGQWAGEGYEE